MTMKINCDKCGYMLGGIEVKENYGCNACNPFWKPKLQTVLGGEHNITHRIHDGRCLDCSYESCNDCGHINGFHLDKCPRKNIFQAEEMDWKDHRNNMMPKAPTRPPLPIKYCGICGMILIQTPIGTYYDHDTAEQYNHWRFRCPQYRWWKIWDRYHSNWRCNEDGSTYAYEV